MYDRVIEGSSQVIYNELANDLLMIKCVGFKLRLIKIPIASNYQAFSYHFHSILNIYIYLNVIDVLTHLSQLILTNFYLFQLH